MTNRQNATSTPGDSARFTSVELSEKAMTTPTTASAPNVFALRARIRVGLRRPGIAVAGTGQHAAEVDDQLDVDVLVLRTREHFGLAASS